MIDPDLLRRFRLLRMMGAADLTALAQVMQPRTYSRNVTLFEQGDTGNAMMLILSGQIRIFLRDEAGSPVTLRFLGEGEVVGEFSLLDRKPRSASAAAVAPLNVLVLQRGDFLRVLTERPQVGVELMRSLAERVRYATRYLEHLYDALELLSNHAYDDALREIALTASDDEMQQCITAFLRLVHRVREETAK